MKRLKAWFKSHTVDLGFWDEYTQEGDGGVGTKAHASHGFGLRVRPS